jgi:hypothetical protein
VSADDTREVVWPPPREDEPDVEPVEPWAKLAERKLAEEIAEWKEWDKWRLPAS